MLEKIAIKIIHFIQNVCMKAKDYFIGLKSTDQHLGVGGGGHSPHILVGMCHGKVKNGGLRSSSSMKVGVSGTNTGHYWTHLAGTLAGRMQQ